jgi:hypothetical protein
MKEQLKDFLKTIKPLVSANEFIKHQGRQKLHGDVRKKLTLPSRQVRKVLFYPDNPKKWNAFRAMFDVLDLQITNDPDDDFLFIIRWEDTTFKSNHSELQKFANTKLILNLNSYNICKKYLDILHQEIFGYCTEINPESFQGKFVKKSNLNAKHDGEILNGPVLIKENNDFIYQILIDNTVENIFAEDIRVLFFKDHIPFVYLKYKLKENMFKPTNHKVIIKQASEVFSPEEVAGIIKIPQKMGLDFAELDVLRNRKDNRIYVIDVNDTPGGFPKYSKGDLLSVSQKKYALEEMSKSFYNAFIKDIY